MNSFSSPFIALPSFPFSLLVSTSTNFMFLCAGKHFNKAKVTAAPTQKQKNKWSENYVEKPPFDVGYYSVVASFYSTLCFIPLLRCWLPFYFIIIIYTYILFELVCSIHFLHCIEWWLFTQTYDVLPSFYEEWLKRASWMRTRHITYYNDVFVVETHTYGAHTAYCLVSSALFHHSYNSYLVQKFNLAENSNNYYSSIVLCRWRLKCPVIFCLLFHLHSIPIAFDSEELFQISVGPN